MSLIPLRKISLIKSHEKYLKPFPSLYSQFSPRIKQSDKLLSLNRGRNNGWSTDMTNQISPFDRPGFSEIIEMTGHFFSWTTGNEFVRDSLKAVERVRAIFTQMSYFFY